MQREQREHKRVQTEPLRQRHDGMCSQAQHPGGWGKSIGLKRPVWNTARHRFKINKQPGMTNTSHLSTEAVEWGGGSGVQSHPRLHSEIEGYVKQNKTKQNYLSQIEKRIKNDGNWLMCELDSNAIQDCVHLWSQHLRHWDRGITTLSQT